MFSLPAKKASGLSPIPTHHSQDVRHIVSIQTPTSKRHSMRNGIGLTEPAQYQTKIGQGDITGSNRKRLIG